MAVASRLHSGKPLAQLMFDYEGVVLRHALVTCCGHRGKAAAMLGISRKNLWEKLRRHARAEQLELERASSQGETP